MADGTHIEWTEATWNVVTGCSVVSPGCTNCYAMRLAGTRLAHHPSRVGLTEPSKAGPVWNGKVRFNEGWRDQPLQWTRPRRIFVAAHGDLFHESVPDAWLDEVFAVMALAPQHVFQVLTKRAARMAAYLADPQTPERIYDLVCDRVACDLDIRVVLMLPGVDESLAPRGRRVWLGLWPLPNVWAGVSVEDQTRAGERVPLLLRTPAAVRWLSVEPLLGPVDLRRIEPADRYEVDALLGYDFDSGEASEGLDWVVVGGESGPGSRPMDPEWARVIRDACAATKVPFFFKQFGEFVEGRDGRLVHVGKKAAGRRLDGVTHDAYPAPR